MARYYFQAEQDANLRMPWPVLVSEDGVVISGRPDAFTLIGFQTRPDVQRVHRFWGDAIADPQWAVGRFPVYSHAFDEGMFVVLEKIERVEVWPDNVYATAGLS